MPHRIVRTADGFRGTFLFLVGLMYLPTSVGFALDWRPLAINPGVEWVPEAVKVGHVGIVFSLLCLFATVVGLFSRAVSRAAGRWGGELIGWGYFAAMAPPTITAGLQVVALFYGSSWAVMLFAFPNLVLAMAIYLASEWPNPPAPPPLPPTDDQAVR